MTKLEALDLEKGDKIVAILSESYVLMYMSNPIRTVHITEGIIYTVSHTDYDGDIYLSDSGMERVPFPYANFRYIRSDKSYILTDW